MLRNSTIRRYACSSLSAVIIKFAVVIIATHYGPSPEWYGERRSERLTVDPIES